MGESLKPGESFLGVRPEGITSHSVYASRLRPEISPEEAAEKAKKRTDYYTAEVDKLKHEADVATIDQLTIMEKEFAKIKLQALAVHDLTGAPLPGEKNKSSRASTRRLKAIEYTREQLREVVEEAPQVIVNLLTVEPENASKTKIGFKRGLRGIRTARAEIKSDPSYATEAEFSLMPAKVIDIFAKEGLSVPSNPNITPLPKRRAA